MSRQTASFSAATCSGGSRSGSCRKPLCRKNQTCSGVSDTAHLLPCPSPTRPHPPLPGSLRGRLEELRICLERAIHSRRLRRGNPVRPAGHHLEREPLTRPVPDRAHLHDLAVPPEELLRADLLRLSGELPCGSISTS